MERLFRMKFTKIFAVIAIMLSSLGAQSYTEFKNKYSAKSFKVYENKALLSKANPQNTQIKINIKEQRIKLLVDGKIAIDSPATTGMRYKKDKRTGKVSDKRTPRGTFKIKEKIADKRSSIFGKLYRGNKMVFRGDKRKYKGHYTKYVGASLKHWMRLTNGGIGIHGSKYIHRVPHSNGCIRVPYHVVQKIFKKVGTNTKVTVL